MEKKSFIIDKDQTLWDSYIQRLPESLQDVYFLYNYINAYTNVQVKQEMFIYEEKDSFFLYPYLLQNIPQKNRYFDIITPYGYGGPLANIYEQSFINRAYMVFCQEMKDKNVVAELVKFNPMIGNHNFFKEDSFGLKMIDTCPIVYLNIEGKYEDLWYKEYTHANRKNIKKAQKLNFTINYNSNEENIEKFKVLYRSTMDRNNVSSFYYFDDNYFKKIHDKMKNHFTLINVLNDQQLISSLLVIHSQYYAHCHLIGTDREFLSQGVNNLLHDELIQWCFKKGIKKLNFGGGRSNSDDDKLLAFKKNFSSSIERFFVGEKIHNPEKYEELCTAWNLKNGDSHPFASRLLKYRY